MFGGHFCWPCKRYIHCTVRICQTQVATPIDVVPFHHRGILSPCHLFPFQVRMRVLVASFLLRSCVAKKRTRFYLYGCHKVPFSFVHWVATGRSITCILHYDHFKSIERPVCRSEEGVQEFLLVNSWEFKVPPPKLPPQRNKPLIRHY